MAEINIGKTENDQIPIPSSGHSERLNDMESALRKFFNGLDNPNMSFNSEDAFDELLRYISIYDRVLYSTISNIIYKHYDSNEKTADPAGTLLSNLDALVRYTEDSSKIADKKKALTGRLTEQNVDDTRKAVLKIWDHVTLASQQYTMLKQSDDEYNSKFQKRISTYKEEMSKEMNTQMITMIGIFTALAFLIFGSISSLDGVFENIKMPIFKAMNIGLIWGTCVLNMIFVFLYCVGKMTKLNFKSNQSTQANIFQRYPVVWWTNLILVALLMITAWGHFIQQSTIWCKIVELVNCSPWLFFIIGSVIILILIIVCVISLYKKTKFKESDE